MKRLLQMGLGTSVVVLLLVACAAKGPAFREAEAKLPATGPNQARLIIYSMRIKVGFDILLDGKTVGQVGDGEVIVVDMQPGSHRVSITSEVEKAATFRLDRGEQKYIRIAAGAGFFVVQPTPELVDTQTAKKDLAGNPPYYEFHLQKHLSQ